MKYLMIAVAVFAALMQCAYSEGRWKRRTKQICTPSPVADVAFVLDASNSIPKNKFKQVLRFVSDFVDTVEIGPEKVQLGIVHFSLTAQTDMLFNRFHEKERMKEFIDEDLSGENGIRQGKRTNTSGGLYVMRNEIFNPANGARQGVPKVAIVITDGKPNEDEEFTIPNANAAKQDNITIMVVGVGQNAKRKC
ncbi:cartilage matrix protein-like [Lingula anatina]|uniref:Cartilage matrix protein-like n=1 Tax=Lingula anatina TaxID=7574 RepID=A0A1S3K4R6_LINAN|nr:cartilage matrix protein-like [Lingula anatina]|eukprot:XP_013417246.1 cartilage matrix protein-like [Lingula anatina]